MKTYLSKHANPREAACQPQDARKFQRQLEHFRLLFKITRSACEKLEQLRKEQSGSFLDVLVVLGLDGKEGEKFDPVKGRGVHLVKVSKYFINGRLACLHDREGKPERTTEPVAPVIRTMEAFMQTFQLRKRAAVDCEGGIGIADFDSERSVEKLVSDEVLKGKSLKDLRAWLVLVSGGWKVKSHEFENLEAGTSKEESLELSLDFREESWKLSSKFFNQV